MTCPFWFLENGKNSPILPPQTTRFAMEPSVSQHYGLLGVLFSPLAYGVWKGVICFHCEPWSGAAVFSIQLWTLKRPSVHWLRGR